VATDKLSNAPEGDPRRDNGVCELPGCGSPWGCCVVWGVAEADTVPLCLLMVESSSRVDEIVKVGVVTVRLSARRVAPSGTRGLARNWGHSEDFSLESRVRPENELRGDV
jgi:hypothetical protein